MAVRESAFDGDLVDGFAGERECLFRMTDTSGDDVRGGCVPGVLAEAADEALHAHACAGGEKGVRQVTVRRAVDEVQHLQQAVGHRRERRGVEVGECGMKKRCALMMEAVIARVARGLEMRVDHGTGERFEQRIH